LRLGDILWKDQSNKKRQKDIDTRWAKKNFQNYYGYKNHTKVDAKSKLIDGYQITGTNVHDSQTIEGLLQDKDKGQELYVNSAIV